MTTMITGGTGLLGSRLASTLVARGERPVLFDYAPAAWRLTGIEDKVDVVRGNIVNLHEILEPMKKYKVNKVALHSLGLYVKCGIQCQSSGRHLYKHRRHHKRLRSSKDYGMRQGVCNPIAVYGFDDEYGPSELPLTEDVATKLSKPVFITYGAGKVYMEALGRLYRDTHGTFVCGLRPSIVYGWGRLGGAASTAFTLELIAKPAKGEPVKLAGGNARSVWSITTTWLLRG